jgi:hypothetical protein
MTISIITVLFWPISLPIYLAKVVTYYVSIPVTILYSYYVAFRAITESAPLYYIGAGILAGTVSFVAWAIGDMIEKNPLHTQMSQALDRNNGEWQGSN